MIIIRKRERLFGSRTSKEVTNLHRALIFVLHVCHLKDGSWWRVVFTLVRASEPHRCFYNGILKHRLMLSSGELLSFIWGGRMHLVFFHEILVIKILRVQIGHFELWSVRNIRQRCLMFCKALHLKRDLVFLAIDGIIEPVSRISFGLLRNRLKHTLFTFKHFLFGHVIERVHRCGELVKELCIFI